MIDENTRTCRSRTVSRLLCALRSCPRDTQRADSSLDLRAQLSRADSRSSRSRRAASSLRPAITHHPVSPQSPRFCDHFGSMSTSRSRDLPCATRINPASINRSLTRTHSERVTSSARAISATSSHREPIGRVLALAAINTSSTYRARSSSPSEIERLRQSLRKYAAKRADAERLFPCSSVGSSKRARRVEARLSARVRDSDPSITPSFST